jgi:hypothetical protein
VIVAILLAAAATTPAELSWEASGLVHAGSRTIAIRSRTTLRTDGTLDSASWPTAVGEAKGLRRMLVNAEGSGWLERGAKSEPMPEALLREEGAQFGFYLQLQEAARWCADKGAGQSTVHTVDGPAPTAFRCTGGRITRAANWVQADGPPLRQDFRIDGLLRSGGYVFPPLMEIRRDGQPYFEMRTTGFRARPVRAED